MFSCYLIEEAYSFLIRERKTLEGDGKGGVEDLGKVEESFKKE